VLQGVLQNLQEGEISPALRTPAGIQIVKLVKKEEIPGKSFEEAKAEIHQKLFQSVVDERYQEWLKRLREKAYIKIML
jgi:peptidyl-prolyl cis-trans isomerase SurA